VLGVSENHLEIKKSKRGGRREGAGRKPKSNENQFAAYEAAERYNPNRTYVYMPTVDPRRELTQASRTELLRKAFHIYNNFGAPARGIDGVARYVGPLSPKPLGGDAKWNRDVEERFENDNGTDAFAFDVAGEVNFYDAQPFAIRHMGLAGDFFWQKILSATGRAMVSFIGGESVGNAKTSLDQSRWVDGVMVNALLRPMKYRVLKNADGTEWTDVDASEMHRIGRPYRRGYTRSPSWLARAANHLYDIQEILGYEKTSTKLNAQIAWVITSNEVAQVGMGNPRARQTAVTDNSQLSVEAIHNTSIIPRLKQNEKLESFRSEHPASNFEVFLNYLMRDVAWGIGISPELLWDITGAGGANTRFLLEDAAIFFRELQEMLITSFCRPFFKFWLWSEIEAGRISHPGPNWHRCEWTPPQRVTVDFGRDGRLMSELLLRGHISPQRYYSLQGLFGEREAADTLRFRARMKKLARQISEEEKEEVTVEECFPPAPGSPAPQPTEQQEQDPVPETPPKPTPDPEE
jgi:capsid protein